MHGVNVPLDVAFVTERLVTKGAIEASLGMNHGVSPPVFFVIEGFPTSCNLAGEASVVWVVNCLHVEGQT